jgi:hypothetical protein
VGSVLEPYAAPKSAPQVGIPRLVMGQPLDSDQLLLGGLLTALARATALTRSELMVARARELPRFETSTWMTEAFDERLVRRVASRMLRFGSALTLRTCDATTLPLTTTATRSSCIRAGEEIEVAAVGAWVATAAVAKGAAMATRLSVMLTASAEPNRLTGELVIWGTSGKSVYNGRSH